MKGRFTLTTKFLISSALAFLVLGSVLVYVSNYQIKKFLLEKVKTDVVNDLNIHTKDSLSKIQFTKPDYAKNKKSFEAFQKKIEYQGFQKIKLYDDEGTIIYSNEAVLVGQNFKSNHELEEALEGKIESEILQSEKEEFSKKEMGKFMEVYYPIFFDSESSPSGVAELYFDISKTDSDILGFQKIIIATIVISLLFLYIILYWIFKKASDTIVERNRALFEATKALRLGQDQDEAILESIGEGLTVVNSDGQILLYNPKIEVITGYTSQEVLFRYYRNFIDLRDKDGKKLEEDFVKTSLKQGIIVRKSHREDIHIKNKEGKLIPVALTIAPILSKEAKIRGLVFTIHDARAEKELDKVKDEFVYVIAHELSNPIFTINGYLSMLLDGNYGNIASKVKVPIETIKSINENLRNLVSDLLEVIRSESGQMKIELEEISLKEIAEEIIKNSLLKAKDKNIKISYESRTLPFAMGNEEKLKEVFINLIDNAIKYSPEKTNVVVSHEVAKDTIITNVKDEGFGMTRSESERLFEKFYRISNDETKGISGTGLGLFIVKALVGKMGGDIWVDSEKGKGTTFSFSLKTANSQAVTEKSDDLKKQKAEK